MLIDDFIFVQMGWQGVRCVAICYDWSHEELARVDGSVTPSRREKCLTMGREVNYTWPLRLITARLMVILRDYSDKVDAPL